ncbi:undecaprenyl/decaprenyl-phosphate alpha-N-acetylglucosaminyl 1-phosphate transferase [Candidatus Gottesmanbacteria bacterium]|nr:undecaprenyl/decaprenyl-phosphate alpha-N-acetylglucosaminyl 1-phosphate transferase [Candidatus Gottesmanbacteria bacterium]
MIQAFPAFLIAVLITFATTPLVRLLAMRWGLVDDPKVRPHPAHTHTGIIPRAGGLAIYIGAIASILLFLPLTKLVIGVIVAVTILTLVGLIDDKGDVNPYLRLATNATAALLVIGTGAGIPYITNPVTGGIIHLDTWRMSFELLGTHSILVWADILAFIWILWTVNIVGWSAGVDGQMPGFVAISAFILGLLSLRYSTTDPSQLYVTILAFLVAGSFLGFLPWNVFPQKIMPGYSGKTLAGFFLALLGILSFGKLGTAILVLGVPTIDAASTLIRRLGNGKSPVRADRGHLHHRLLDLGWGKRRIALFYWGVSAILGWIALTVTSAQKLFALLVVGVTVGGFITWVNFFSHFSNPSDPDSG